jgi:hypothetical protein
MFYTHCWACGERWGLGTQSTCKCPDGIDYKLDLGIGKDVPSVSFHSNLQLGNEVLKVTKDGEFIWNEDADRMIAENDWSFHPALKHILIALRDRKENK